MNEPHDFVPTNPDSFTVTFVRGGVGGRLVERDLPSLCEAQDTARGMNEQYGQYGRRAVIHAVKGNRSWQVVS